MPNEFVVTHPREHDCPGDARADLMDVTGGVSVVGGFVIARVEIIEHPKHEQSRHDNLADNENFLRRAVRFFRLIPGISFLRIFLVASVLLVALLLFVVGFFFPLGRRFGVAPDR